MKRLFFLALCAAFFPALKSAAQTSQFADAVGAAFGANKTNIEYGEAGGKKLLLDAHVPDGDGKFPVAIIVHGGGWSGGDKETDIAPLFAPFAANFTWFTINYRLAPTNRWPACFEDLQTAIRWVKKHAAEFKGDPGRIALVGYSSGGHLVCLAATLGKKDTRVQAVVGLAPPTDIVTDAKRRGSMDKWPSMENLLNSDSLDEKTLKTMEKISPLNHVQPGLPPFLLVQGDADKTVLIGQTLDFAAKLQADGISCDFITLTNAQHRIADWDKFDAGWQRKTIAWLEEKLAAKTPAETNRMK
ncbi:MAG TPA: alpha/beta hydrolase [Verrucomicrobiae bacterium]|jgi:acetyl esterase/lipase